VHCDEDLFEDKVNEIKRERNALWLGMGDYGDCVTPMDFKRWDGRILAPWMKGHEYNIGQTQCNNLDEQLSPIWNKCIGLIEGNHEDSMRRHNHYDLMENLLNAAHKKNSEVKYAGVSCFIRLNFKRKNSNESHDYIIHARHGEGCARTPGARAMAVLHLSQSMVNAHIVLMGHLHGQESPDMPQRMVLRNGKIKSFETVACMTGAWIRAYMQGVPACYLERWGSPASSLGCPRIVIEPDKDRMTLEKSVQTIAM
jgi:hypothetical protein